VVTSIIGTFFVRLGANQSIMGALYKGFIATGVLSISLCGPSPTTWLGMATGLRLPQAQLHLAGTSICAASSASCHALIIVVTEYYTGTNYRPVRHRRGLQTGHGTNVIQAWPFRSRPPPSGADHRRRHHRLQQLAGLFGIAIAVTAIAVGGRAWWWRSTPSAPSPTTPAASPRWRACPRRSQDHRRARRRRQHHQGRHQGLCHRLGGLGRAGAVCRLQRGPEVLHRQAKPGSIFYGLNVDNLFSLSNPYVVVGLFLGGLLPYLFGGITMTGGRPRGSLDRGGGAPAVPREARHHEGDGKARLCPCRRHADARRPSRR
jgi:K(+)-stimulated pyrophosphate-energized sodium pump